MPAVVIAHRGASGTAPENTLAAFRRAAAVGAAMIELDVQLTRDGHLVVLHDDTLDRTTDGSGLLADHTLAEVERLDAGRWFGAAFAGERVPTLRAVLAAIDVPLNVELKAGGGAPLVVSALAVVEAAGALERVVFSSFEWELLEAMRAQSSRATVAVLSAEPSILDAVRLAGRIGATAVHLRKDLVTSAAVLVAARAGLVIRAWTVNDAEEKRRLEDAGVAGIFTDYPERFLLPVDCGS